MRGGPPETAAHLANDGRLSQYILLWLFSFLFHENEIKNYFFLPVSGFFVVVVAITQIHISKVCLGGHT
jgi:hypothetical protein